MNGKRSAVVLVFSSDNEMLLQRRADDDKSYPSCWDFSAAGGIDEGETPEQAAVRELREEIGVSARIMFIEESVYRGRGYEDRLWFFRTQTNGPFIPQPEEVSDVRFFTKETIEEMLSEGLPFHPEFPFAWDEGIISRAWDRSDA